MPPTCSSAAGHSAVAANVNAAAMICKERGTGEVNVGIYRHMVHEKNLLGVQLSETADGNIIWKKYEKRGISKADAPWFWNGAVDVLLYRAFHDVDVRAHVRAQLTRALFDNAVDGVLPAWTAEMDVRTAPAMTMSVMDYLRGCGVVRR